MFQAVEGRKSKSQIQCPNVRADWKPLDPSGGLQPQFKCPQGSGWLEMPVILKAVLLNEELTFSVPIHHPSVGGRVCADDFIDIRGLGS